jgi:hypothetical protein
MFEEDDGRLKKTMADLAQTINRVITESADVQKALEAIKKKGYGVDVSLAACIGLYKSECPDSRAEKIAPLSFEFNRDDLNFLKSLKIKLNEK